MTILILGLVVWAVAFLAGPRLPGGKGASHGLAALAVVLMVLGYRMAEYTGLYQPPVFLKHLNNLMMLIAAYILPATLLGTRIGRRIRNPFWLTVKIWAVAHLLVRGDLASVVLFGGLLAVAVVAVIFAARARRASGVVPVARGPQGPMAEVLALVAAVVLVGALGGAHAMFGLSAFGG